MSIVLQSIVLIGVIGLTAFFGYALYSMVKFWKDLWLGKYDD